MCWGAEEIPHLQHTGWSCEWAGIATVVMNACIHHIQDCLVEENSGNHRDEQCKSYGDKWRALDEGTQLYVQLGGLRVPVYRYSTKAESM